MTPAERMSAAWQMALDAWAFYQGAPAAAPPPAACQEGKTADSDEAASFREAQRECFRASRAYMASRRRKNRRPSAKYSGDSAAET